MNEVSVIAEQIKDLSLDEVEKSLLQYEQAECPVQHEFIDGFYIRRAFIPAGVFAMGHEQRFYHVNRMIAGKVEIFYGGDGKSTVMTAPCEFVGEPGRKVGYIIEDVIWENWYDHDSAERDIEKVEAMYLNKSEYSQQFRDQLIEDQRFTKEEDRQDYNSLLLQIGYSENDVQREMADTEDYLSEYINTKIRITDSPIQGKGVFLEAMAFPGQLIGISKLGKMKTPLGRYLNHSKTPNATFELQDDGNIWVRASKYISGRKAGLEGDEVVVDYREAISLVSAIEFNQETQQCPV